MQFPLPLICSILIIVLALILYYRLLRKKFTSSSGWYVFVPGSLFLAALLFFFAPWVFISMHSRWIFAAGYILCLYFSSRKNYRKPWKTGSRPHPLFIIVRLIIACITGFLVFMYFDSYWYNKKDAVKIDFPFKNGSYYFMQAGSNRLSNPFHSNYSKIKYGYAVDIAKLNKFGNRANSISPNSLTDYEIYGDSIFSPCEGKILHVTDGVPDNIPGELNVQQIHGNHLVIQAKGYRVFLAHLKVNTLAVKQEQKVKKGQFLGLQGNAGFSVEPHLHLNVLKNYNEDDVYSGISVPPIFNNRFYTINEIINP